MFHRCRISFLQIKVLEIDSSGGFHNSEFGSAPELYILKMAKGAFILKFAIVKKIRGEKEQRTDESLKHILKVRHKKYAYCMALLYNVSRLCKSEKLKAD